MEGFLEEVCIILSLHKHHHLKAQNQPLAIIKKISFSNEQINAPSMSLEHK